MKCKIGCLISTVQEKRRRISQKSKLSAKAYVRLNSK